MRMNTKMFTPIYLLQFPPKLLDVANTLVRLGRAFRSYGVLDVWLPNKAVATSDRDFV